MKISIFSTSDINGGAARAAFRLVNALKYLEQDVNYFVRTKKNNCSSIVELDNKNSRIVEKKTNKYYIDLNRTSSSNTLFSFSYDGVELPNLGDSDIINLHWVDFFLDLDNLREIVESKKIIVWTLHDMKPFTGGCHYSNGCKEYENNCLYCNQLYEDKKFLPKRVLEAKKTIFEKANLVIVSPSEWLAKEARKSSLFANKRIEVIPNSIEHDVFLPIHKSKAKKILGIDNNHIVLTFGVMNQNEKRKGFSYLTEAISILKKKMENTDIDIVGLLFGTASDEEFPIKCINLGSIADDKKLSIIYSAADIFILPSLEDNLPNTILESFSCGTPVVAFDSGGIKDLVNDNNGKIVEKYDVIALANSIYELAINDKLRESKGSYARKMIETNYKLSDQATKYLELFKDLITNSYSNSTILPKDLNEEFDDIIGYSFKKELNIIKNNNLNVFSESFVKIYDQIERLNVKDNKYLVYGAGKFGNVLKLLLGENFIGFIDKNLKQYPFDNLNKLSYDKIIISVLGREDEIIDFLIKEFKISKEKIIRFKL
jgi:glycosyltransferase involved in cell wall biosynthesis